MRHLLATLAAVAALGAPPAADTFVGTVTDEICEGSHAAMQMGPTDAECTVACHEAHGAAYVLFDGTHAYKLSDQDAPKAFAGHKVKVVGRLDAAARTIRVESITGT
jgi:hypothetical protein